MKRINNKRTGRFKAGIYAFIPIVLFLGASSPVVGQSEYHTVQSADGTTIGFTKTGTGSVPVVFVHGALNTHEQWLPVATAMSEQFTCYVMDRWGRGGSSYREIYSIKREAEDITAVLEAAGPDAFLMGHSSGAIYALEAAIRAPISGLILYEPPLHLEKFNNEVMGPILAAANDERFDDVVSIFLTEEAGLPEEALPQIQETPMWDHMVAHAPQSVREWDELVQAGLTVERYNDISVPTLLLSGSQNENHPSFATETLAQTISNARIEILEGQGHTANLEAPGMVVKEIANFILETKR